MSDPSRRPVYTKSRSTKRKRERLHGAFKGGFSAGHFNTVGSKNGWTPSYEEDNNDEINDSNSGNGKSSTIEKDYYSRPAWRPKVRSGTSLSSKKGKKKQSVEDFMDEEDANDWGGPSAIRKDYVYDFDNTHRKDEGDHIGTDTNINTIAITRTQNAVKSISDLLSSECSTQLQGHVSIGKKLLRVLGWREAQQHIGKDKAATGTEYVYLPVEEGDDQNILHASKRIKRIELKLSKYKRLALPKPKMDTYGLGYDAFQNAPEFKAHKEMRQQRAIQRAKAASSSKGDERMNVYRTSDILGEEDEEGDERFSMVNRKGEMGRKKANKDDERKGGTGEEDILAYETTEDFIGKTTAAGFALHDDDDDVYDDQMGNGVNKKASKPSIDKAQYCNEAFEASDSDLDDDDFSKTVQQKKQQKANDINEFSGALSAWATGTGGNNVGSARRRVIAVTSDGKPPLQGFRLGNSMMNSTTNRHPGPPLPKNYVAKRRVYHQTDALKKMKELSRHMRQKIMTQRKAESAKSTSMETKGGITRDLKPMAGGSFSALATSLKDRFTVSRNEVATSSADKAGPSDPTQVVITRKSAIWQPSPLLCKRMNVNLPRAFNASNKNMSAQKGKQLESQEESFFQKEVIGKIKPSRENDEYRLSGEFVDIERPTMEFMKSIFEPESDDDMSISDDDQESDDTKSEDTKVNTTESQAENNVEVMNQAPSRLIENTSNDKDENSSGRGMTERSPLDFTAKPKRKGKKKDRKHLNCDDSQEGRGHDDNSTSDSDDDQSKRDKRRRHRKARKHSRRKRRSEDGKSGKRKRKKETR
eukprot:scaffold2522_cov203-Chaetoceros_neogracile.AAC.1